MASARFGQNAVILFLIVAILAYIHLDSNLPIMYRIKIGLRDFWYFLSLLAAFVVCSERQATPHGTTTIPDLYAAAQAHSWTGTQRSNSTRSMEDSQDGDTLKDWISEDGSLVFRNMSGPGSHAPSKSDQSEISLSLTSTVGQIRDGKALEFAKLCSILSLNIAGASSDDEWSTDDLEHWMSLES